MSTDIRELPDKTIALIVLSVYIAYILGLFKFLGSHVVAKRGVPELIIALHSLCFWVFYIYFPRKSTIIKGIILCIIIPVLSCVMLYISYSAIFVIKWKLPLFLVREQRIDFVLFNFISYFGLAPYAMLGAWFVSLPLLIIYGICLYLSRFRMHYSEVKNTHIFVQQKIEMNFLKHRKFTLISVIIYIVFILVYAFFAKTQLENYFEKIFYQGVFIYAFSFLSILYIISFIDGKMKKYILYCLIIPIFWPVFVYIVHAILILLYTSGTPYFRTDIFTLNFYLDCYLRTQAWFISLPLLLVCYIYSRLTKLELTRQTGG